MRRRFELTDFEWSVTSRCFPTSHVACLVSMIVG